MSKDDKTNRRIAPERDDEKRETTAPTIDDRRERKYLNRWATNVMGYSDVTQRRTDEKSLATISICSRQIAQITAACRAVIGWQTRKRPVTVAFSECAANAPTRRRSGRDGLKRRWLYSLSLSSTKRACQRQHQHWRHAVLLLLDHAASAFVTSSVISRSVLSDFQHAPLNCCCCGHCHGCVNQWWIAASSTDEANYAC